MGVVVASLHVYTSLIYTSLTGEHSVYEWGRVV